MAALKVIVASICFQGILAQSSSETTVSTAVPSPSAALDSPLPSQVPDPPTQAWCPSEIFCAGPLLQTVNVAALYSDPKTFVDKPTNKPAEDVLFDFENLTSGNVTEGQIVDFVDADFRGEGLELEALTLDNFNEDPPFLANVSDSLLRAWAQTVHGYWTQLIRTTNSSVLCSGTACESSLIPLNHTFVVPGGRFREQYYWDSFWIVEGLLESQLYDIVNDTLQNFMDELDTIGFIPNGGRIYYLNRSQPPLFIQMLFRYITVTNDTSILTRALPLAEKELDWWQENRTVNVTSPSTNKVHEMARYAVNNTAPRPESYLTDYLTANGPDVSPPLNESQRSSLYAELASGAETGWDYTSRWFSNPAAGNSDLKQLNVRNTIPVDLNSILYRNHIIMEQLYSDNETAAMKHHDKATSVREGILDLSWNSTKMGFYDFNIASGTQNHVFSAASYYPVWSGITPVEILRSAEDAFKYFAPLNLVLKRYNGTFPSTFLDTSLQWDFPNTWAPHQYIILQALRALPSHIADVTLFALSSNQSSFNLLPADQLGISESQLPSQTLLSGVNATNLGHQADINTLNGTVLNGGNTTIYEGWSQTLQRELANRYFASAFCSWHATGGEIPGILPRLSDAELNVTQSVNNTGNMFEKFSSLDIDSAGRGGEYTVQAGFGWTNGVVLWIASVYGDILATPNCPALLANTA
ncbi:glycoside hydrolase [Guyanagaster necrorhizus]|uniref:Trehalase n=1 Tax=Guyanagaster necrorhizus TaxID=856835 RepID=A0A9P7VMZ2_9AGAR|nr:glycoside hydrolase [Guyanagaster necrorhizus MCA 3950]KAG7444163.1 glycoside hydrolase [Guyanagaster necrorhizus MCA 3950]